ncbi:MAG: hypothetical protein ACJAV0_000708 [Shewanella sp.]|jgi:hypothetical protein|tara:strand:+ start:1304 stop:1420 length:117 start_codon:yes stop_codon:yes gene_type:complete
MAGKLMAGMLVTGLFIAQGLVAVDGWWFAVIFVFSQVG